MLAIHKFIELKNLHNDVRIRSSPIFLLVTLYMEYISYACGVSYRITKTTT